MLQSFVQFIFKEMGSKEAWKHMCLVYRLVQHQGSTRPDQVPLFEYLNSLGILRTVQEAPSFTFNKAKGVNNTAGPVSTEPLPKTPAPSNLTIPIDEVELALEQSKNVCESKSDASTNNSDSSFEMIELGKSPKPQNGVALFSPNAVINKLTTAQSKSVTEEEPQVITIRAKNELLADALKEC